MIQGLSAWVKVLKSTLRRGEFTYYDTIYQSLYLILRIQMEVHVCEYKYEIMTDPYLVFLIQVIA